MLNVIERLKTNLTTIRDRLLRRLDASRIGAVVAAHPLRSITYVLIAMTIFTASWLLFTEVDRVVVGRGTVITSEPKYIVRALNKSVIRSINVKAGTVIKKGELIVTLDPTTSDADVKKLAEKFESFQAKTTKIEAHLTGRPYVSASSRFDDWELQNESYNAERKQFEHKRREFDDKIFRLKSYIQELASKQKIVGEQIAVAAQMLEMWDELVNKNNFGSRTNYLKAQNDLLQLRGQLADSKAEATKVTYERSALISEKLAFVKEWESKRLDELASTRRDMRETQQDLIKAETENRMVTLTAHEDAVILEVADISEGSVVTPSDALVKLISLRSPLSIEAKIDAQDIAHVSVGQGVEIKLDSLPYQRFGVLFGEILSVSRDSFSTADTLLSGKSEKGNTRAGSDKADAPYYLVRIAITTSGLRGLPETFRLIPGLTSIVDIKVGKRPVSEFLLFPLQKALNEAMREP
jgi:hemolysin D